MKLYYITIYLLLSFGLYSQFNPYQDSEKILWNDDKSFLLYVNDAIHLRDFNNKSIKTFDCASVTLSNYLFSILNSNDSFTFLDKNKNINIVSRGGGMVYKSFNDTIYRIDNSFDHKMTFGSDIFVKNDTIFKFGGYGYWSSRNFITYFDDETSEWEFFKTNPINLPPSISQFGSSLIDNKYYIFGGKIVDPYTGIRTINNKSIWAFDFSERTWDDLGTSNIPYFEKHLPVNIENSSNIIFSSNDTDAHIISFIKNEIRLVSRNKSSFNFIGDNVFYVKDTIFNINHRGQLIFSDIKSTFDYTNPKKINPIYVNTRVLFSGLTRTAFFSILLIIMLILYLKYKRNQKPRVSDFGIRYKGISYSFKAKEKIIIKLILSKKLVSSQEIYDAVEDTNLSYPQNNKIKNDTIKKVNNKIEKILGINNFIESKKLETDGRILIYFTKYSHLFVTNK